MQSIETDMPQREIVPPTNAIEKKLIAIWASVLNMNANEIGIHDNYFSLGGDSILGITIVTLAEEQKIHFSVDDLFKFPTIAGLSEKIDAGHHEITSLSKVAPFELLIAKDRDALPDLLEDAYPLTRLQEGMLFHSLMQPDQPIYQNTFYYRIRCSLDENHFRQALVAMMQKHPLLRTSFAMSGFTQPLQLVHQNVQVIFNCIDLQQMDNQKQQAYIEVWLKEEKHKKIMLDRAPLLQFNVFKLSDHTIYLFIKIHHTIMDGWSVASLVTELFEFYMAIHNHQPINSAPIQLQFRDYVKLEQNVLHTESQKQFWHKEMSEHVFSALPRFAKTADKEVKYGVDEIVFILSDYYFESLLHLSKQYQLSLKNIFFFIHLKVIAEITGQNHISSGLSTNGRLETADGEKILGLFLNPVPFNFKMHKASWISLIREIDNKITKLYPFRRYPQFDIKKMCETELFEISFNYNNYYHIFKKLGDIHGVELLETGSFEQTNLNLHTTFYVDSEKTLCGFKIAYNIAILNKNQVEDIQQYYMKALEYFIQAPEREDSPSLMSDKQKRQLQLEWNQTRTTILHNTTVHHLFGEQAQKTPDCVAITFENQTISYRSLNERANQLAHYLRHILINDSGVDPQNDCLIGLCVERSIDSFIGLLGILKAGAAYVPIDPYYPEDYLADRFNDSKLCMVLTHKKFLTKLRSLSNVGIVCMDNLSTKNLIESYEIFLPNFEMSPERLMYVIYTSGSTGESKGISITHRNVVNYVQWVQSFLDLDRIKIVDCSSTLAFDFTVTTSIVPLLSGKTVALCNEETQRNLDLYFVHIQKSQPNFAKLTPSYFALLVDALDSTAPNQFACLRYLMLGGEPAQLKDIKKWLSYYPNCQIINHYGPTETTVGATKYMISEKTINNYTTIPIGQPRYNTQAYIVNDDLQLTPIGTPGELLLGGLGLARDYLHRPDLTTERFIANPFATKEDIQSGYTRLYRTGDLCRWLPDGNIEYLGRIDNQVKIRGFRIELGEIEVILSQHPDLLQCVIIADNTHGTKNQQLIAYIKSGEFPPSQEELRAYLIERLPEYMVPSMFIMLDEIPLTANGKIDRKTLLALKNDQEKTEPFISPRNEIEKKITHIWAEVLGIDYNDIGMTHHFYELGGHSINAIAIVQKLERIGILISIKTLFEQQTIEKIALFAGATLPDMIHEQVLMLSQGKHNIFPSTFMQRFILKNYQYGNIPSYHPQHIFKLSSDNFDCDVFLNILRDFINENPTVRIVFEQLEEGHVVQRINQNNKNAIRYDDFTAYSPDEQMTKIFELGKQDINDQFNPYDTTTSLYRFYIIKLSEHGIIFMYSFHHAVSDGWSNRLMRNTFYRRYEKHALSQNDKINLYSSEQNQIRVLKQYVNLENQTNLQEKYKNFWKTSLEDSRYTLKESKDEVAISDPISQQINLSTEIVRKLIQMTKKFNVSFKVIFLNAYFSALRKCFCKTLNTIACVSNARDNRLQDVLTTMGMFWKFQPLCIASIKEDQLMKTESLTATQQIIDSMSADGNILFNNELIYKLQASFNYTDFTAFILPATVKVTHIHSRDFFHYPVNCHVSHTKLNEEFMIRLDADDSMINVAEIREVLLTMQFLLEAL